MTALTIRDLQRRLTELGRIRLGDKGARGEPKKLTKFRLTSASRSLLESAAQLYGGQVREWKGAPDEGYFELYTESSELDILIPPTLAAYSQAYELWDAGGRTRWCDGETERLSGGSCLCDPEARECQVTTRVNVMLPRVPGLGVWRLDTKGWNAAATLPSTLELLGRMGAGEWIPAVLRIEQRTVKRNRQTRRFIVPVLDLPQVTIGQLVGMAEVDAQLPAANGHVVDQQAPALPQPGPGRGPRRERVSRPALPAGPPPPAQAEFRRDERPPTPQAPELPPTPRADPETGEVIEDDEIPFGGPVEPAQRSRVELGDTTTVQPTPTGNDLVTRLKRVAYANHDRRAKPATDEQKAQLRDLFGSIDPAVIASLLERAFESTPVTGRDNKVRFQVNQAEAQALLEVASVDPERFTVEAVALAGDVAA